jgi:hypothetical protein
MDEENTAHTYNRILFSFKMKAFTTTRKNLDLESEQCQL